MTSFEEDHPICVPVGVQMFTFKSHLERPTIGVVSKSIGGIRRMDGWKCVWWNSVSVVFVHLILFKTKPSSSFSVWVALEAFTFKFYEAKIKQSIRGRNRQ